MATKEVLSLDHFHHLKKETVLSFPEERQERLILINIDMLRGHVMKMNKLTIASKALLEYATRSTANVFFSI
jgi:hypothetical protein